MGVDRPRGADERRGDRPYLTRPRFRTRGIRAGRFRWISSRSCRSRLGTTCCRSTGGCRWRLQRIEAHEAQEWYRKPGRDFPWVPVFDPHRAGADRDVWPIRAAAGRPSCLSRAGTCGSSSTSRPEGLRRSPDRRCDCRADEGRRRAAERRAAVRQPGAPQRAGSGAGGRDPDRPVREVLPAAGARASALARVPPLRPQRRARRVPRAVSHGLCNERAAGFAAAAKAKAGDWRPVRAW
jgi:hypothetical protein